jgi:hypothetical protein
MAEPQSAPDNKKKKSWRAASTAAPNGTPAPARKRRTIFKLLATMLALAGIFLAILFAIRRTPKPDFVAITADEYKDLHIPVNAWSEQDREALVRGGYFDGAVTSTATSQELREIRAELDNLKTKKKALVLYLCAHVLCDDKGTLCLLPGDADIDNPETWLPLSKILQSLRECPAPHKLLLLDVMRPLAGPRLGVLVDDVAERVETVLREVPDDKRVVLCACSPGQVALASEELGQSVFGYYLKEGLRGWADGWVDGKQDRLVSVQELARFVTARVDRWARENRGVRQTPVLVPSDGDFILVEVNRDNLKPPEPSAPPEPEPETDKDKAAKEKAPPSPYPAWLRAAWQERDQWWDDQSYRDAPLVFRNLEETILRYEKLWRGGRKDEILTPKLANQLEELRQQRNQARTRIPRPDTPASLALAAGLGRKLPPPKPAGPEAKAADKKPEPTVAQAVETLLKTWDKLHGNPDPKAQEALLAAALKEFEDHPKDKPAVELTREVFEAAAACDPQPDRLHFLYGLIRDLQPPPVYVEILTLKRLDAMAAPLVKAAQEKKEPTAAWPRDTKEAVRRALQVARDGERAAACVSGRNGVWTWDPRPLPWIRTGLTQAAQLRHDGETLLFAPGFASPAEAYNLLDQAYQKYRIINDTLETLHNAYGRQDEALVRLPGLLPFLLGPGEIDGPERKEWQGALQRLQELHDLLAAAPREDQALSDPQLAARISDIQQKSESLRGFLDSLMGPFVGEGLQARMKQAQQFRDDPKYLLGLNAALEVPWLRARDREEVWKTRHQLAKDLADVTRQKDDNDNRNNSHLQPPEPYDGLREKGLKPSRATRESRTALDLMRLAGLAEDRATKLDEAIGQARTRPEDATTWPALGQMVRTTWDDLAKQLQSTDAVDKLAWDWLSRLLPPVDVSTGFSEGKPNPGQVLRREQAEAHWRWLGDRCRYEQRDLAMMAEGSDELSAQFARMAQEYRDLASGLPPAVGFEITREGNEWPNLREDKLDAECRLRIKLMREPPTQAVNVEEPSIRTADKDWLVIDRPVWQRTGDVFTTRLLVRKKTGAEKSPSPAPQGFLFVARLQDGRSFHYKVHTQLPRSSRECMELVLSDSKEAPSPQLGDLKLRPNTQQAIFVFVRNPTKEKHTAIVELQADTLKAPLLSDAIPLEPNQNVLVKFKGEPGAVPAVANAAAGDAKNLESPPLSKPSFQHPAIQLRVWDKDDANKIVHDHKEISVSIMRPYDYLRRSPLVRYYPNTRKLVVQVDPAELEGSKCPVELVIPEQPACGLIPTKPEGTYARELTPGQKEPLELTALNLKFAPERATEDGIVYLNVDHYQRAFVYRVNFAAPGYPAPTTGRPDLDMNLHIAGKKATKREEPYRFRLEIENAPAEVTLQVDQDPNNDDKYAQRYRLDGDRKQRVHFNPAGADGELIFRTEVQDWPIELSTQGIGSTWGLRVQMFLDKRLLKEVRQPVTPDDTEPEGVHFVSVNDTLVPDQLAGALEIDKVGSVSLKARGRDPQSGIERVLFYVGGESVEGKRPANVAGVPAYPVNEDRTEWRVDKVNLPAGVETVRLTVEFENGVGLPAFDTMLLKLGKTEVKKPEDNTPKLGTIKGKVSEGSRNPPGLKVILTDLTAKMEIDSTKTDESGAYTFEKVKPGTYKVSSSDDRRFGEKQVTVKPGETETVDLALIDR